MGDFGWVFVASLPGPPRFPVNYVTPEVPVYLEIILGVKKTLPVAVAQRGMAAGLADGGVEMLAPTRGAALPAYGIVAKYIFD